MLCPSMQLTEINTTFRAILRYFDPNIPIIISFLYIYNLLIFSCMASNEAATVSYSSYLLVNGKSEIVEKNFLTYK